MRLWCQDKNVYNSGCPSHLLDFFSLENAEVFTESSIFLEGHLKDASNEALMEPWKPKLELNWALPPRSQHFTEKPSEKSTTHSPCKEKATLSSLGQKGNKCLQIISFVLLHWCCSRQLQFVCWDKQLGLGEQTAEQSHPKEIHGTPASSFPHCRFISGRK